MFSAIIGAPDSPEELLIALFLLKRFASFVVTLVFASLVVFAVLDLLPGNAAQVMLGESATPESVEALTKKLGLDHPAPQRYLSWLTGLATLELGNSQSYDTPIVGLIAERLAVTVPLALTSPEAITVLAGTITMTPGTVSAELSALPMWQRADVGPLRLGIVHGDATSLAGWGFAQEHLRDAKHREQVASWFDRADVDAFACTHTCLPVFQAIGGGPGGQPRWVLNNGAAGMPNLRCHIWNARSHSVCRARSTSSLVDDLSALGGSAITIVARHL